MKLERFLYNHQNLRVFLRGIAIISPFILRLAFLLIFAIMETSFIEAFQIGTFSRVLFISFVKPVNVNDPVSKILMLAYVSVMGFMVVKMGGGFLEQIWTRIKKEKPE